jgi:hypothetical protein
MNGFLFGSCRESPKKQKPHPSLEREMGLRSNESSRFLPILRKKLFSKR